MYSRIRLICVIFVLMLTFAAVADAGEWYEGGTLHESTAGVWKRGSYADRLATSADFVAKLTKPSSMTELRQKAVELEACISEAVSDSTSDGMKVTGVASTCAVLLGYPG